MGTALALGEQDPRPPPTTFLETKLCLGNYASLQYNLLGEGSPFADQVLALIIIKDLPKVFGTRDQWYDYRCRHLIRAVFDEGVTYCGCRLNPDGFYHPKENIPLFVTTFSLAVGEFAGGEKMYRKGLPKEWKWEYH